MNNHQVPNLTGVIPPPVQENQQVPHIKVITPPRFTWRRSFDHVPDVYPPLCNHSITICPTCFIEYTSDIVAFMPQKPLLLDTTIEKLLASFCRQKSLWEDCTQKPEPLQKIISDLELDKYV